MIQYINAILINRKQHQRNGNTKKLSMKCIKIKRLKIAQNANSGGVDLPLIYISVVLFIAVLGCYYCIRLMMSLLTNLQENFLYPSAYFEH